jgi:ABC-2 type transport system ATP-binding protein
MRSDVLHRHPVAGSVEPAVLVTGMRKSYGKVKALDGVDLLIPRGSVFSLLGPNGSGKTTLIRILTTLLLPDGGTARIDGLDVVRNADALRERIGLTGQFSAVDDMLTGRENIELVGRLTHLGRRESRRRADLLLERFSLTDAARRLVRTYSGGMRRRLDIAASLVHRPRILFLDEPTTGLDPRSRIELWRILNELVADGTTLFLTTQYLEEADHLADAIVVLDHGRVIAEGSSEELKARVGGNVLEVHLRDHRRTDDAVRVLSGGSAEAPHIDPMTGRLTLPAVRGAEDLVEAVRRLDRASIDLADIGIRRPTLDDVFLALTGHEAADAPAAAEPVKGQRA